MRCGRVGRAVPLLLLTLAGMPLHAASPGGSSGGVPTRFDRLRGALGERAAPPPVADLVRARDDAAALARVGAARQALVEFERLLAELVPLSPGEASRDRAAGRNLFLHDAGDLDAPLPTREQVVQVVDQASFLTFFQWYRGDPMEAFRHQIRLLRLGSDLAFGSSSSVLAGQAMAIQAAALRDLTRMLLEGTLDEERTVKLGKLLRAYSSLVLDRERAPALVKRTQLGFEASLRRKLAAGGVTREQAGLAARVFRDHSKEVLRAFHEGTPLQAEERVAVLAGALVGRYRQELGFLDDIPLHRGLGILVGRLEAARALADGAAWVSLHRARTGRWPTEGEIGPRLPDDPLGKGAVRYRLFEGRPVLASVGTDGKFDGFRMPEDMVVAPEELMELARRLDAFASSFALEAVPAVQVPAVDAARGLASAPLAEGCGAGREKLERLRAEFERRHRLEVRDRPALVHGLLHANGVLDVIPRCDGDGLWTLVEKRWICTLHRDPGDPELPARVQAMLLEACRANRRALARAGWRLQSRDPSAGVDLDAAGQARLVAAGFLERPLACPAQGGQWKVLPEGLVCRLHGPMPRLEAKPR